MKFDTILLLSISKLLYIAQINSYKKFARLFKTRILIIAITS